MAIEKKTMHTFGRIKTPKNKKVTVHEISVFSTAVLKKFMKPDCIIRMADTCYQYKGSEIVTWQEPKSDFIRVKENNDIIADLLL